MELIEKYARHYQRKAMATLFEGSICNCRWNIKIAIDFKQSKLTHCLQKRCPSCREEHERKYALKYKELRRVARRERGATKRSTPAKTGPKENLTTFYDSSDYGSFVGMR